jgi:pyruvate dehydrogenase E1 component
MPALPAEADEAERVRLGTIRGMYRFADRPGLPASDANGDREIRNTATLLFSGSFWQAAMEARTLLADDWGVDADAWSVTSYKSLREDCLSAERWNRLHPGEDPKVPLVTESLAGSGGPVVAVTDFVRAVPDQISRFVPRHFTSLGTDGFGRSDTRDTLRRFFEVDAAHIVVAVLDGLVASGDLQAEVVSKAIHQYGIDASSGDPWTR